MKVMDVIVNLDKIGATVMKKQISLAEVAILTAEHQRKCGGKPVTLIEGTENETPRTKMQEYGHLMGRYASRRVKSLFPAASGAFPETFEEAVELGMSQSQSFSSKESPILTHQLI